MCMKKLILLGVMICQALYGYSQFFENAVTFEVRYPVPVGDNFMNNTLLGGSGYVGIIDAGVEYHIFKKSGWGIGIAYNTSLLQLSEADLTAISFIPKLVVDYNLALGNLSLVPQAGFGYSYWRYKGYDDNIITDNGMTFEGSLKFVFRNEKRINWFLQFAYEFTRLEKPENVEDTDFNRNIQLIYPGLGVVWRLK